MANGIDASTTARLVEFLPMAYCRVMFKGTGIQFSDNFQRRLANGEITPEKPLSSEPVWNAVIDFAEDEVDRGISRDDLLSIAGRSAEFSAANQLLSQGSKLKDLRFTAMVLVWSDSCPET